MSLLEQLGWGTFFEDALAAMDESSCNPARVVEQQRDLYKVRGAGDVLRARLAGALRNASLDRAQLPAVGDWVAIDERASEGSATIHAVLPRRTVLVRRQAGKSAAGQVIAANIDHVFLVTSCRSDFNPRRIERTLTLLWESGAQPVLILNKRDLAENIDDLSEEAAVSAPGVPVHAISATLGEGVETLDGYLRPGRTVALVGSSGTGKSTLINRLAGEQLMAVSDVRESDSRGRHTTTFRRLLRVPSGALLVDTPGMREVGLWSGREGIGEAFSDIDELAMECRYKDCRHQSEPDCAVKSAIANGELPADRVASYHKLQRELTFLETKKDARAQREQKQRNRREARAVRKILRRKE